MSWEAELTQIIEGARAFKKGEPIYDQWVKNGVWAMEQYIKSREQELLTEVNNEIASIASDRYTGEELKNIVHDILDRKLKGETE